MKMKHIQPIFIEQHSIFYMLLTFINSTFPAAIFFLFRRADVLLY